MTSYGIHLSLCTGWYGMRSIYQGYIAQYGSKCSQKAAIILIKSCQQCGLILWAPQTTRSMSSEYGVWR